MELTGGNNTAEVVRIGDTVRRSRSSRSAFIARLLTALEVAGFANAPRYLGVDAAGRDVLTFIPGETTTHPSQRREEAYRAGGQMLRALHEITSRLPLAGRRACVIHGDPGPFNTVFRDGMPVALIDWDSARPGGQMSDLAYMAWTWCIQSAGHVPVEAQADRLRRLRDGYGIAGTEEFLQAILRRQRYITRISGMLLQVPDRPTQHYERQRRAIAWAEADRAHLQAHAETFLRALR